MAADLPGRVLRGAHRARGERGRRSHDAHRRRDGGQADARVGAADGRGRREARGPRGRAAQAVCDVLHAAAPRPRRGGREREAHARARQHAAMVTAELDLDLYTDEALGDPHPRYRAIRDRAPAVWLPAHQVWALGRYDDVRAALRADDGLVSGRGVALSERVNQVPSTTTLVSDGEVHRRRGATLMRPMMPSALADARREIERLADALVEDLAARPSFDGVADFARHLPVTVVSRLVGLPEAGRERMLEWAAATFDAVGPANARAERALGPFAEMLHYAFKVEREALRKDGWAAGLFDAADAGALEPDELRGLLIDYIAPSLDTTIQGAGHLLYLLGAHPEQYERLRADPALVPSAVHEALRFEAPVR